MNLISKEGEQELLKLSRYVLKQFIGNNKTSFKADSLKDFELSGPLLEKFGVFVTLKRNEELRGCIGHVYPHLPLFEGVIENTINASSKDPRFSPVREVELDELHIEISVMSPLTEIGSIDDIVVGRDGLLLKQAFYSGLLLPQVPIEWNWDRNEFLKHLSLKSGLHPEAYKDPRSKIFRFSAQVFAEN